MPGAAAGAAIGRRDVTARVIASLPALLACALPAAAQPVAGNPGAGHELAARLCTACHIVGGERVGSDVAPPFLVIARDPGVTLGELHAWVGPAHPILPHLALTPEQIADINAYLDSLHGAGAQEAPQEVESPQPPAALERAPPDKLGDPIRPPD
jgi:mono/diheme cytochrome c family protein